MEWMGLNDVRESFLAFFESKEHKRLPSFPLVPQNDNTLLLINAGMAPMKKFFLGQEKPPAKRVCTCQKCIRTPDIERVGKTARHGTYFEMLGNFSFGDYFKHEATAWAWEYITKVLKMPEDRLWVTIYQDDDEAYDIWTKEVGVDPSHMARFGREDNFWEHGSLPCGPCSEIYYDRGEKYGCGKPDCKVGCDCDRYVEFWNLVFQQFDSDGKGHYTPLPKPNIDTGMGLERLAVILQDVDNLFEVDTIQNIMKHIGRIADVAYGKDEKTDVSLRVITDHIRSTTFMAADGILPSNEGRGYVLRRLLRRAARHGRLLGIEKPFLADVVDTVVRENEAHYPELREKQAYIERVIRNEEERFAATIDQGLSLLETVSKDLAPAADGRRTLGGDAAFRLYDTYGFPLDLTREILAERGIGVDEKGFDALMTEQRERARAARAAAGEGPADADDTDTPATEFVGYRTLECDAKVAAILSGGEREAFAPAGAAVSVILDRTPFYAESGGQVGDAGLVTTGGATLRVDDCKKSAAGRFVHIGEVVSGTLRTGDAVKAQVDAERRRAVMRNHSAAHLLQAALRRTLGDHVRQAGQLVDEHRVRFDFTHFAAVTPEELKEIETQVNGEILAGLPVTVTEMPRAEAEKLGAMALFGEKYGDVVRVVKMGDVSLEFCGGTHAHSTAELGLFKIVSESSVAAGVRRIEAVTGRNVLSLLGEQDTALHTAAQALKVSPAELSRRAQQLMEELREKNHTVETLQGKLAAAQAKGLLAAAKETGPYRVIAARVPDATADTLRLIGDRLRDAQPAVVALLGAVAGEKVVFAACCGKDAVKAGANAGKIVRAAAQITGGGGGGRPDAATAGGKDAAKLDEALASVYAQLGA